MIYLQYGLAGLVGSWMLWVFYVCAMRLKMVRNAGALTRGQKIFGFPTIVVGYVLDIIVNFGICTFLFLELPREWTVSSRFWRHSNDKDGGWRMKLALFLRTQLLDSVDPKGIHKG